MSSIKAGVIGLGFIGPAHVEALRRLGDVEVVAVAGARPGSTQAKAARMGVPRAYDTWQELVADPDVQVIHNCTPNFLHTEINLAAIAAGKHVVSEKPLGVDAAQAAGLVQAAKSAGIVHEVCFNNRMYPLTREMQARVASGAIGDVRLVQGAYLQDWLLYETDYNWRLEPEMGGRARTIGDIGSHWCDLAEFVAGSRITAVFAELLLWLPKRRKPTVHVDAFAGVGLRPDQAVEVEVTTEDCGLILLRFENGARGSCLLTQMAAGHKNALSMEVNGSEGSLRWDLERPNELWLGHRDGPNQVMAKDPALLSPDARPYAHFPGHHNEGYPDTFKNLFEPVYQAIREGSGMPADPSWPTFETGYRANLVVDAILRSAQEQRWVTVA